MNVRISRLVRKPITWVVTALTAAVAFTFLGVAIQYNHSEPRFQEVLAERDDLRDQRDEALENYEAERAEPPEVVTETVEVEVPDVEHEQQLDQREGALDEREAELDTRASELEDREAAVTEAATQIEEHSFGSGTYVVGEDIEPGEYRSDGGEFCYWERLSGTSGEFSDIITNSIDTGTQVVTIAESDVAFSSDGCGEWSRS